MWQPFSSKPRLYSRRRIFLLFGNPIIRHRVHGTPPLNSSSSRSYLNTVHTCSHPVYCVRISVLPFQPRRRSNHQFLGAFVKLPTATISSVMSVSPRVRPHGTTRLPLDGFSWNLIRVFPKICREDQYIISGSFLLRMRCFRQNLYRKSKHAFYVQ
jgi:hypothetical protein